MRLPGLNPASVQEILRLGFEKNYLESYQLLDLLSSSYGDVVSPAWKSVKLSELGYLLSDITGADIPDWIKTDSQIQKISSLLTGAKTLGLLGEMLDLVRRGHAPHGAARSPAARSIFEGVSESLTDIEIMECVRRNIMS